MSVATEAQLAACVRQSLDAFLYQNAVFMCERLYAEFHTEVRDPFSTVRHLENIT